MRGFPLNLNPGALGGEDGPPPGFPYFGAEKFEFGYGGPVAFHHEFFGAHPPPHPHGPPFSGPGNPGESLEFDLFSPNSQLFPFPIFDSFFDPFRSLHFIAILSRRDREETQETIVTIVKTERNVYTIFKLGCTRSYPFAISKAEPCLEFYRGYNKHRSG